MSEGEVFKKHVVEAVSVQTRKKASFVKESSLKSKIVAEDADLA